MAKLETTADNLQWKSNMIISKENSAELTVADLDTDGKYLSAKATAQVISNAINAGGGGAPINCDDINPIGSVIITSTNTNPGLSLGGTWELFDKEYKTSKDRMLSVDYALGGLKAWEETNYSATIYSGYAAKSGHDIRLNLVLTTRSAITGGSALGNRTFGKLHSDALGFTSFDPFNYQLTEDRFAHATNDVGTEFYMIRYIIGSAGEVIFTHVYDKIGAQTGAPAGGTLPANAKVYINTDLQINAANMLDSFCDKFYWKRTA